MSICDRFASGCDTFASRCDHFAYVRYATQFRLTPDRLRFFDCAKSCGCAHEAGSPTRASPARWMLPELLKLELPDYLEKIQNDTRKFLQRGLDPFIFQMHYLQNCRMRRRNGSGNTSFLRVRFRSIRDPEAGVGIMPMKDRSPARSPPLSNAVGSPSERRATVSGTALQRICWKRATTSERCRNGSATTTRVRR